MNDKQDFLNRINADRSQNFSFGTDKILKNVYDNVVGKTFRMNDKEGKGGGGQPKAPENKAQVVINADQDVKKAVQNLVLSLIELGDKEIALKLISEHIFFLNDIFKDFDNNQS